MQLQPADCRCRADRAAGQGRAGLAVARVLWTRLDARRARLGRRRQGRAEARRRHHARADAAGRRRHVRRRAVGAGRRQRRAARHGAARADRRQRRRGRPAHHPHRDRRRCRQAGARHHRVRTPAPPRSRRPSISPRSSSTAPGWSSRRRRTWCRPTGHAAARCRASASSTPARWPTPGRSNSRITAEPLERELAIRKMELDADQLERLRNADMERARRDDERRRALEFDQGSVAPAPPAPVRRLRGARRAAAVGHECAARRSGSAARRPRRCPPFRRAAPARPASSCRRRPARKRNTLRARRSIRRRGCRRRG